MAFAVDKNVDDIKVAVTLFMNVAKLIALARIFVENTSEGMSQAPGPIPMNNQSMNGNQHHVPILKVARYRAKEATANQILLVK
jgi:hypothetical protein